MFDTLPKEGQKLMPLSNVSKHDWQGLESSKFGGTRRHLRPVDQLNGYEGIPDSVLGRRHYEQNYSSVGEYKPQLKVFPHLSNKTTDISAVSSEGANKLTFVPPQRKALPEQLSLYSKKLTKFEEVAKTLRATALATLRNNSQQGENQSQNPQSNEVF